MGIEKNPGKSTVGKTRVEEFFSVEFFGYWQQFEVGK